MRSIDQKLAKPLQLLFAVAEQPQCVYDFIVVGKYTLDGLVAVRFLVGLRPLDVAVAVGVAVGVGVVFVGVDAFVGVGDGTAVVAVRVMPALFCINDGVLKTVWMKVYDPGTFPVVVGSVKDTDERGAISPFHQIVPPSRL